MQTVLTSIYPILRNAVTMVLVLALLVSVGYTGQGKIVCKPAVSVSVEQPSDERNLLDSGSTDPSGGKMAPSKTTQSIPATFNATPMALKSIDERTSDDREPAFDSDRHISFETEPATGRLPHSSSMISTDLGRQSTLVGAKPSGTM